MNADKPEDFWKINFGVMSAVADNHGEHCSADALKKILEKGKDVIFGAYDAEAGLQGEPAEATYNDLVNRRTVYYSAVLHKRLMDRQRASMGSEAGRDKAWSGYSPAKQNGSRQF
ncbi:hypothetical protein HN935_01965 [archaeon]|jgi:hypothetical protein|nr:hypothetical protein [archaeon]